MKTIFTALILLFVGVAFSCADQEPSRILYVVANGAWYAKCIPLGKYSPLSSSSNEHERGKTLIYLAGNEMDRLIYTLDWYSPRIFITGKGGGVSIVRLGKWPSGQKASEKDLAISFYRKDKIIASYSTLDLAGAESNVSTSVSHYTVIKEIVGFVNIFKRIGRDTLTNDPDYGFEVVLHDDRHVVFDLNTGKQIPILQDIFTKRANY
jgi:hypothetical protein